MRAPWQSPADDRLPTTAASASKSTTRSKRAEHRVNFDHEARIAHYLKPPAAEPRPLVIPAGDPTDLMMGLLQTRTWDLKPDEKRDADLKELPRFTALALDVSRLEFSNADARGEARASWRTADPKASPDGSRFPGVLDLQAVDMDVQSQNSVDAAGRTVTRVAVTVRTKTFYTPTILVAYGAPWSENFYFQTENVLLASTGIVLGTPRLLAWCETTARPDSLMMSGTAMPDSSQTSFRVATMELAYSSMV